MTIRLDGREALDRYIREPPLDITVDHQSGYIARKERGSP
jgi:hypothetical protein